MTLIDDLTALAQRPGQELPATAMAMARLSLLDWTVCCRAGRGEPLTLKLRQLASHEGGAEVASLIGGSRAPARMAALVNGAASHALDFDDTHFGHVGHLSVGIFPAALAAGEETGASLQAVVEAFLVGAEAAIRVGRVLGSAHYDRGFHQTATAGAFGACLAAGRLYGLTQRELRAAIGLCSTRSSGLKSQFGTMGKPYNAGISASNGIEAAKLAQLGMTSTDDGIEGPQGFVETHSDAPQPADAFGERFLFEDNKYKFHACCHGLHAMIEALLKRPQGIHARNVAAVNIRTPERWLRVCDIKRPRTGLEVKFSYNWLAGMVLHEIPTGDDGVYTDSRAADPELAAFADRVTVTGDKQLSDNVTEVELRLEDGRSIHLLHDLMEPVEPEALRARLEEKAATLLEAEATSVIAAIAGARSASDIGALLRNP